MKSYQHYASTAFNRLFLTKGFLGNPSLVTSPKPTDLKFKCSAWNGDDWSWNLLMTQWSHGPHGPHGPHSTLAVVMKNCEPLVFGPPLAIAIKPLLLNFMRRFCGRRNWSGVDSKP